MPEDYTREHFKAGLRDDTRLPNGDVHLVNCDGMKAMKYGASKELSITDGTDGLTTAWPFPQMFKGHGFALCLTKTGLLHRLNDGTLEAITVYDHDVSGSELLADTDFSSWDDSEAGWTIAGTEAGHVTGVTDSITDTVTSLPAGLYRFTVDVSAVSIDASTNDKMFVHIGSDASESQIPQVGTMEFDVITTGAETEVSITAQSNVACTITAASLKAIATITPSYTGTTKPFNFTSFGKVWFLTNNDHTFMCAPMCGTKGAHTSADYTFPWRVVRTDATQMATMANFNRRLYVAGFDSTDAIYSNSDFVEAFDVFMKKHTGVLYENFVVDKNVVFYGMFNGGDVKWPFAADLALLGAMDTTHTSAMANVFIQAMRDGDMGFIELPFAGECLRILPLPNALVCYCTDGVCAIVSSPENPNLHQVRVISNQGLCDRGAVTYNSSANFHMYLDLNGKLRFISNELIDRELGYDEFLLPLVTNLATAPPILSVDTDESEVYICNNDTSFLRTREGLGQIWTTVTSVFQLPKTGVTAPGLSGVTDDISPVSGLAYIKTAAIDYGNRQFKLIHDLEVGAYDVTNLKVRVHYKNNHSTSWQVGEWMEVIRGGFTIPVISGFEFAYELEFTPGAAARIEYIKAEWQIRDSRNFARQSGRI